MDNIFKCFVDSQIELEKAIAHLKAAAILEYYRGQEIPDYERKGYQDIEKIIKQIQEMIA